ncbi:phage scaffolding protein [Paenibacillus sp. L3-i20]|uniref:phage scaffolding protein n=1 Tax=Paenibacillus sp. L3-i20 TaxID=2905833 RepID=UPI001EDD3F93|nr:phage scaffolding protein [Paenibacillus sp. L3-i20]GKU79867.1 hypothetical protein L3i20_v242640 [Paenibacillus sp. L3-i20]
MDWLKELLKAQGLTDTQITAIVGGVETNYKGWVPEHRFKEINDAKKAADESIKDRDKQLEDLKKSAGDNATLKDQIDKLQGENKIAQEKYDADLKELQTNTALKMALSGKVHDVDLVSGLIDKTKIELDEAGNVKSGFDDQFKALQTSKAFLFVPEDKGGNQFQFKGTKPNESGGSGGNGGGGNAASDFGKRIADFSKTNADTAKAQQSYFE